MEKNYKSVDAKTDFIAQELEILEWWAQNDVFKKLQDQNAGHERWSFLDGPITANNPMGVHHAWGRTYKDIYQRYMAMRGFEQRYQNGFDCQGLWVEVEVERELGFKSKRDIEKYGVENFVNKCKDRVHKYAAIQTEQSKRLGYWMDWDNSYYTMSDENNYSIWHFLQKVHEKGWLYKGKDSMPWCPRCGTGLSQHEMAEGYKEIEDKSVFVRLPLVGRDNEFLVIWTTTPWTLSANVAAAVAADLEYSIIEHAGQTLYLHENAIPRIFGKKYKANITGKLPGSELIGWEYAGPFDEFEAVADVKHRVIPWEEVSAEEGSGIVHIAPGCGKEDFDLGKVHDLQVLAPINVDGVFVPGYGWQTGQSALSVAADVIADLKKKELLLKQELYSHRYPHCWRCKTKLVYRVVTEWYISMDELRYQIMDVAKQIEWMPGFGLDRELDWLKNMSDWMISKKRYWGLALPIYECGDCGNIDVLGSREELQQRGVAGWDDFDGHSPHRPWVDDVVIDCSQCGQPVKRILDVGNPWLDAGIVPFSTMGYNSDRAYWEQWFPADFITESFPGQFRNWFYSLLAMSTVLENKPPFKKVLGYALVKDSKGNAMHKSDGNAIWFDDAANDMGVDVIRWMYADHNPENNLWFGYEQANEVRRKLLTLWNSYSFFVTYAALDNFNPVEQTIPVSERTEIDRWMVAKTQELIRQGAAGYGEYRVDRLMRSATGYLDALSNWYIRRNRRRFWKSGNDQDKIAAYVTLHESLVSFAKVMAPVIPFLAESIYRNLVCTFDVAAPSSVHLCPFPEFQSELVDDELLTGIDNLIAVVALGRSARNKANIKIRQPLSQVVVQGSAQVIDAVQNYQSQLLDELNIKALVTDLDSAKLIKYNIQPNLALVGPRFGKDVGKVKAALSAIPAAELVGKWQQRESIMLVLDGETSALSPQEILVEAVGVEPYSVAVNRDIAVGVDMTITGDLKAEGTIRDLIRQVQNMRKEADLRVEERIVVGIMGSDHITESMGKFQDYFLAEVLGTRLYSELPKPEHRKVVNLDGSDVSIGISRAEN